MPTPSMHHWSARPVRGTGPSFPLWFLPAVLLLSLMAAPLQAQSPDAHRSVGMLPPDSYDPTIPTLKQVLGFEPGENIATPEEMHRYLRALEAASPRIKVSPIGKSWEGRELMFVYIGSEANISRLDDIKSRMQQLADPRRTSPSAARTLMSDLPALVNLSYAVHGNELSPGDAALLTAYHLVAAQNDPVVEKIRANVVVQMDPLQNPDGRNRWVNNFVQALGLEPDPSPLSAERNEPWPRGRSNHYLFDMNRDWLVATQPETRARIQELRQWTPLVFVDLHEMGSDSTYYFAPEAVPYNPWLTPVQRSSLDWFGKTNARYFDRAGLSYFTREIFDAFYPGYGASWPAYFGAIAMTYEQASSRGLKARTSEGREFPYSDTVRGHFLASVATCETAADKHAELLQNFYEYRRTAVEDGRSGPVREFILPRAHDVAAVDKLAGLLAFHGLEVKKAQSAFRNGEREYPAGSYVVPLSQPNSRLAHVLLEKQVTMDDEFLAEQERRRAKNLGDEIYDVTAWSLPLAFNIEAVPAATPSSGDFQDWLPDSRVEGVVRPADNAIAYIVPWDNTAAGRFLTAALQRDLDVLGLDKGFRQVGRDFPRGTLVLRTAANPANLGSIVAELARETGAEVVATDSGWVESGINFGSRYARRIPRAKVAMAWDNPVSSLQAGHTRFVLERQFGYPVTAIRTASLSSGNLSRYDTLILPATSGAGYERALGPQGIDNLKRWVRNGGTLVAIGSAVDFLRDEKVALLSLKKEGAAGSESNKVQKSAGTKTGAAEGTILGSESAYLRAIGAGKTSPDQALGVLVRGLTDADHWLSVGCERGINVIYSGNSIYTPLTLAEGVNVGYLAGPENLLQSGYLWDALRDQLAYKPFLVTQTSGRGNVIGFITDPTFRAMMDGNNLLLLNAVFRGPAHSRKAGGD
jgi:hypothetical protein